MGLKSSLKSTDLREYGRKLVSIRDLENSAIVPPVILATVP
jgi:hypothetical protein